MVIEGKIWKFGDDVNTDEIIPARYLNTTDPGELAQHCMEDADPDFMKKMSRGDLIVAGKNFGCGSSREHAPIAIKAAGVPLVIAENFARIFYRNALNIGLPILESAEAARGINQGDRIRVDLAGGAIENLTTSTRFQAKPFPPFMREIMDAGGLMKFVMRERKTA